MFYIIVKLHLKKYSLYIIIQPYFVYISLIPNPCVLLTLVEKLPNINKFVCILWANLPESKLVRGKGVTVRQKYCKNINF